MANIKSAAKRARQSKHRTARNASVITALKTQQKKFLATVKLGKKEAIHSVLATLSSTLDKAANHGVIHKNSVNRRKATLAKAFAAVAKD